MRFLLPALAVVLLDQITKQVLWRIGAAYDLIGDVVRITLVRNSGAAFGLFQGGRIFLIVSSIIASILLIVLSERIPPEQRAKRAYLGLILGGAVGNLVDRIYPGHVIDFVDIGFGSYRWPVFNVADAAVTIGGILLILSYSRSREEPEPKIEG